MKIIYILNSEGGILEVHSSRFSAMNEISRQLLKYTGDITGVSVKWSKVGLKITRCDVYDRRNCLIVRFDIIRSRVKGGSNV